jgi:signal transduction histidine kinase
VWSKNCGPINLARLIDEVVGTAGHLAEKNKNQLIVEAQESVGALNAGPMRLKQILLNLLSNGGSALLLAVASVACSPPTGTG